MYHEIEQVLLSFSLPYTAEYCDTKMVMSLITNLNAANIFFLFTNSIKSGITSQDKSVLNVTGNR
jgi:hypothetical protein